MEAVASGLRNVEVELMPQLISRSDAWSFHELKFGPELVPVTFVEQLEQLIQDEVKADQVPTHVILKALSRIVGSEEIVLWKDTLFMVRSCLPSSFFEARNDLFRMVQGKGDKGHRLLVAGGSRAAVVQWEYYAAGKCNPYA